STRPAGVRLPGASNPADVDPTVWLGRTSDRSDMAPKLLIIPIITNYGSAHPQTGQPGSGLYKTRACFHSRRSDGCDDARRYLFCIDLRAKCAMPAIHGLQQGVSSCFAKRSGSRRGLAQSCLL